MNGIKLEKTLPWLEEPLDRLVYRPIAWKIVPILAKLRISPNIVSIAAGLVGISNAILFIFNTLPICITLLLINISIILDCADGQLARYTNTFSKVGKLIDGIMDYLIVITWYISICITISITYECIGIWIIATITGFFHIAQAISFEAFQYFIKQTQQQKPSAFLLNVNIPFCGGKNTKHRLLLFLENLHDASIKAMGKKLSLHRVTDQSIPTIYRYLFFALGHTMHLIYLMVFLAIGLASIFFVWILLPLNSILIILMLWAHLKSHRIHGKN